MKSLLVVAFLLSPMALADTAPTEFVTQTLEPTGGKIQMPKEWFYLEHHHGPVYSWTLSKEKPEGIVPYTTGVAIQTFTHVQKGTGKSAKQFLLDFAAARAISGKVVKTCEARDQGMFTRICLEVEEGIYHVLYSLFWLSSGGDIAIVSSAGTTKELWSTYAPTFERMASFELIDMKRFEK
jgi:hypothetical protein